MFALFLIVLTVLAATAAVGVLADSGLRWWSAFGQLRTALRRTSIVADLPLPRPAQMNSGYSAYGRASVSLPAVKRASRAA